MTNKRDIGMKIAVIGSGVAGIGAAWALSARHDVTLIEAEANAGGHSRTLDVEVGAAPISVDTGFIVYNERNYPHLTNLLRTLAVPTVDSDMSFAVSLEDGSFEYAGRLSGLFTDARSVVDPSIRRLVRGIVRFRSEAKQLQAGLVPDDMDIYAYLVSRGYPDLFMDRYLMPLASAVWSGTRNNSRAIPAASFLRFLDNHGLIGIAGRPQWKTIDGGSRNYVERAIKEITRVHTRRPVHSIRRTALGVEVFDSGGAPDLYDEVVLATHADVSLRILGEAASEAERRILSAFRYDANEVVLHTDTAAMPRRRRIWSAWNAIERTDDDGTRPVSVSYWMNRLQPLHTRADVFVTLNPGDSIDATKVIDRWNAAHPQFDLATGIAQREIPTIQGIDRVWFAGAHLGHGFHEDALQSGLTVAAALGSPVPWHDDVDPRSLAALHAKPRLAPVLV
ncbi:MAG: NAD/FAD-binding protein [Armatimonadetes bacterium]|nr:MAG: NAD/FAD-binding protein [Armatimonadota bacterium]